MSRYKEIYDTLLNLDKLEVPLKCDRESNKDDVVHQNLLRFHNQDKKMAVEDFLKFLDAFKELRTDYGIKKDARLSEKLYPNLKKLHKELQARPQFVDWSHALFVGGRNKFAAAPEGEDERAPTADDYINMLPDEPVNPGALSARRRIAETYSYDTHTKTIPAQRVECKVDNQKGQKVVSSNRVQSAGVRLKRFFAGNPSQQAAFRKTPIMAQRYFMRQDLVNKGIIEPKHERIEK